MTEGLMQTQSQVANRARFSAGWGKRAEGKERPPVLTADLPSIYNVRRLSAVPLCPTDRSCSAICVLRNPLQCLLSHDFHHTA